MGSSSGEDAYGICGKLFDSAGSAVGSWFVVNAYTTGAPA